MKFSGLFTNWEVIVGIHSEIPVIAMETFLVSILQKLMPFLKDNSIKHFLIEVKIEKKKERGNKMRHYQEYVITKQAECLSC